MLDEVWIAMTLHVYEWLMRVCFYSVSLSTTTAATHFRFLCRIVSRIKCEMTVSVCVCVCVNHMQCKWCDCCLPHHWHRCWHRIHRMIAVGIERCAMTRSHVSCGLSNRFWMVHNFKGMACQHKHRTWNSNGDFAQLSTSCAPQKIWFIAANERYPNILLAANIKFMFRLRSVTQTVPIHRLNCASNDEKHMWKTSKECEKHYGMRTTRCHRRIVRTVNREMRQSSRHIDGMLFSGSDSCLCLRFARRMLFLESLYLQYIAI